MFLHPNINLVSFKITLARVAIAQMTALHSEQGSADAGIPASALPSQHTCLDRTPFPLSRAMPVTCWAEL